MLFSAIAAVVHQGGIGTMGQALRAGRPTLVVPMRTISRQRLQIGEDRRRACVLSGRTGKAERVASDLRTLLENPSYLEHARAAKIVSAEDGAGTALRRS
jgi:UDP:flavonoid glycosyltransferase YjiC (YdhE family)